MRLRLLQKHKWHQTKTLYWQVGPGARRTGSGTRETDAFSSAQVFMCSMGAVVQGMVRHLDSSPFSIACTDLSSPLCRTSPSVRRAMRPERASVFFLLIAPLAVNGANLFYPNQVRCPLASLRLPLPLTLGNLLSAVWHRRRHAARHPPRRPGQLGSSEPLSRPHVSLLVYADSPCLPSHSTSARRA